MKTLDPFEMMEAHIHLNLGIYFDNTEGEDGVNIATSRLIPDMYWNYGYSPEGASFTEAQLGSLSSKLRQLGREPMIWQLEGKPIPPGWEICGKDAWMWLDRKDWKYKRNSDHDHLSIHLVRKPDIAMQRVFEDAMSSGTNPEDIGYFDLPKEYSTAYLQAKLTPPATCIHLSGYAEEVCASIATMGIWNDIGGLYSVATAHEFRRRGYALHISYEATRWAFEQGAKGVLLQTEADSPVEELYAKLGYKRTHIGYLLRPIDIAN